MIKTKSLFDSVDADDGVRIWVEPIGLTRDLCQWCEVTLVLPHLGPPRDAWDSAEGDHKVEYGEFRARYHEWLERCPFLPLLQQMAQDGLRSQPQYEERSQHNYTLLHQGDDPAHNSAAALLDFIVKLDAHCPPD